MEYTFTWFIENYSYCLQYNTEALCSPEFSVRGLENTAWRIRLYPRGKSTGKKGWISLFLQRSLVDVGPDIISPKFELSLLGPNGSAVISKELHYAFRPGCYNGFDILHMVELLLLQQDTLLPRDTLRVRCKLWNNEERIREVGQGFARTHIGTEHVSFLHVVKGFKTFGSNKNTTRIRYSTKETVLKSNIYLDRASSDGRIISFEIVPSSIKEILSKCDLFLLGTSGSLTKCGEEDIRTDAYRNDISRLYLSLTKENILDREAEYLPDGKLTLLCQCTFSTGVKYERIERTLHEIPSCVLNPINNDLITEKVFLCSSVIDELRRLCNTVLPLDVELRTITNSYRAHKILLYSRSPVFKDILTKGVAGINTEFIPVYDLENDTVEKLLQFLYFDNLENLQWDSAIKLYCAANVYLIEKLKLMCSSILISNLSASNAGELLLLAETYKDSDLQRAVNDFMRINSNKFMVQTNGEN